MMPLAFSSADPIVSASFLTLLSTETLLVIGTAISRVATTATTATIIVVTGAPPQYLVFIVQSQQYKFIFFLELCQVFLHKNEIYISSRVPVKVLNS